MDGSLEDQVAKIVLDYRATLAEKIASREKELLTEATDHQDVYRVLGIAPEDCPKIDLYQNIGRFVYRYAGSLLEDTTRLLLSETGEGETLIVENVVSRNPAQFHIDCYTKVDNRAHEIKWRDATTDGDHVTKERNKIASILAAGHIPVRVMYYVPVRRNARRIQEKIIATFRENGEAYIAGEAWDYVRDRSGVDLRLLLSKLIVRES